MVLAVKGYVHFVFIWVTKHINFVFKGVNAFCFPICLWFTSFKTCLIMIRHQFYVLSVFIFIFVQLYETNHVWEWKSPKFHVWFRTLQEVLDFNLNRHRFWRFYVYFWVLVSSVIGLGSGCVISVEREREGKKYEKCQGQGEFKSVKKQPLVYEITTGFSW